MRHVNPPKQGPTLETGRHSQELYKGINNVSWGIRNVVTNHDLSDHPGERASLLVSPWLKDEAVQCFWISWLLCPWDYPCRNSGAGCHFLLQGIFPTQGWKSSLLCLLHGQVGSLALPLLGSPHRELHGRCCSQQQVCEGLTQADKSTSKVAHSPAWQAGDGCWLCTSSRAHRVSPRCGSIPPPEDGTPQRGTRAALPVPTSSGFHAGRRSHVTCISVSEPPQRKTTADFLFQHPTPSPQDGADIRMVKMWWHFTKSFQFLLFFGYAMWHVGS